MARIRARVHGFYAGNDARIDATLPDAREPMKTAARRRVGTVGAPARPGRSSNKTGGAGEHRLRRIRELPRGRFGTSAARGYLLK
jgi:hypothetical protein